MNRFEGRCVMITGGASGIGAATASSWPGGRSRRVADRQRRGRPAVARRRSAGALAVPLDVTDEDVLGGRLRGGPRALRSAARAGQLGRHQRAGHRRRRHPRALAADHGDQRRRCLPRLQARRARDQTIRRRRHREPGLDPGRPAGQLQYVAYSASKAAVLAVTRSTALHCAAAEVRHPLQCGAAGPPTRRWWTSTSTMRRICGADGAVRGSAPARADRPARRHRPGDPVPRLGRRRDWVTGVALPVDGGYLAA
jgi:NAD(P)-dependent dehydrogenase (short-subunit alcohol dehydrogenase family)